MTRAEQLIAESRAEGSSVEVEVEYDAELAAELSALCTEEYTHSYAFEGTDPTFFEGPGWSIVMFAEN